jgi:hypothetical protein
MGRHDIWRLDPCRFADGRGYRAPSEIANLGPGPGIEVGNRLRPSRVAVLQPRQDEFRVVSLVLMGSNDTVHSRSPPLFAGPELACPGILDSETPANFTSRWDGTRRLSRCLRVVLAFGAATLAPTAGGNRAEGFETGWELMQQFRFSEAATAFRRAEGPATNEARLGRAIALLNAQPRTRANLAEAEAILATLSRDPATAEWAAPAGYFRARLVQFYQDPPDLQLAATRYWDTWSSFPDTFWGQHAAAKWVLLQLYVGTDAWELRLAAAQNVIAALSIPSALRDAHLSIAQAALFLRQGDEATALAHFQAAAQNGFEQPSLRSEVDIAIAELAFATGDLSTARHHYDLFLRDNRRDNRRQLVKMRLAELAAPTLPASP